MTAVSTGVGTYVAGEGFSIAVPRRWRRDGRTRAVISVRGYGGDWSASDPYVRAFAELGVPAGTADFAFVNAGRWATDTVLARITALWDFMKTQLGVRADKVVFSVGSGGTFDALNWAMANPGKVAAVGAATPALDWADIHDNNRDNRAAEIETRYGGLSGFNAVKASRNPAANPAAFAGLPLRLVYSEDDPICLAPIVRAFGSAVGDSVTLENVGNQGHTVGANYDGRVHNDWLLSHA